MRQVTGTRTIRLLATVAVCAGSLAITEVADGRPPTSWGPAEAVPNVSSPVADGCPIEAPDGRSLFIASVRDGGDNDIWVATRRSTHEPFGTPTVLPEPVNSTAEDFCPTPLRGGYLLFVSTRGGVDAYGTAACGGGDIYVTRRSAATGAWKAPRNLGCAATGDGPNMAGTEYGPSLLETWFGKVLYFSSGGAIGTNTQDIYTSRLDRHGSFGPPTAVAELNTPYDDAMPNVRKDGREIVFTSNRPGGQGLFDIYAAARPRAGRPWSASVALGTNVNTSGSETRPSFSWHGNRLYFGRNGDIYVSHRRC